MSFHVSAQWNGIYMNKSFRHMWYMAFVFPQMPSLDPKPAERSFVQAVLWFRQSLQYWLLQAPYQTKKKCVGTRHWKNGHFGWFPAFFIRSSDNTNHKNQTWNMWNQYLCSAEGLVGSNASAMCFLAHGRVGAGSVLNCDQHSARQAQGKPCRWINHAQPIRAQDVRRCGRSCFDSNPKIHKLICLRFLQSCLEDSWGFDEDVVGPLNHSVVWAQNLSALEAVHIFGTCAWMHKRRNMNCVSGKIMEPTPYHHLFVMKSFFTR